MQRHMDFLTTDLGLDPEAVHALLKSHPTLLLEGPAAAFSALCAALELDAALVTVGLACALGVPQINSSQYLSVPKQVFIANLSCSRALLSGEPTEGGLRIAACCWGLAANHNAAVECMQEMARSHPAILAVPPGHAARVLRSLRAAGLQCEELHSLLQHYPGVLGRE